MGNFVDLTGKKFGKLTVIKRVGTDKWKHPEWLCKCDCGNETIVASHRLVDGVTQSCGCIIRIHGEAHTRLYHIWIGMKSRCFKKNHRLYKHYGGRGITVCPEWCNYCNFRDWALNNGYQDNLSIDRIDVNGDYCPENCRWATQQEQCNNTRRNHRITYKGETHNVTEWSKLLGMEVYVLRNRLNACHWSIELAFTTPPKKCKRRN